ncbi:FAD dependent oxidoreductase [Athelia psychrophila]|uniref:FAD dependent oxidoreductase n=1 Tax=Athelia psychrophila TaxID=1759441 RepID=A0A166TPJ5_9AGAM|nr:FAD dependent oxidoreductase [Fibularhizoctonia sp. CBS 109695]
MSAHEKRILIVGSGCFGISTAYHLLKRGYTDVTVVDRAETLPAVDAASTDLNKIVRSAYEDVYYAQLGQRAIEEWTTNAVWRPAYDQSGLVIVGYKDGFFDAAQAAGTDLVTLADAAALRAVYPPALQNGGLGTMIAPIATYSRAAGSAKAAKAVELTIDAVRALGGKVLTGKESCGTLRDGSGRLTGVRFKDGSVIETDYAVLAAGAWTASAFPELGLDKLIFASGQSIATIKLPPDLAEVYRKCPISLSYNAGFYIFPPNDDNIMKICTHSAGYTHTPSPSSSISTPRTFLTDGTAGLQIPTKMAMAIRDMLRQVYPEIAHLPFESTRLCWYTYSNDEDWVIDEVAGYKNLFVATAGSGHGFKFLPVIGELIADRLEGKLAPEIAHKFSMSRDRGAFKGGYGVLHEPIPLDLNDLCTDFNH